MEQVFPASGLLLSVLLVLQVIFAGLLVLIFKRQSAGRQQEAQQEAQMELQKIIQQDIVRLERTGKEDSKALREELLKTILHFSDSLRGTVETQLEKQRQENAEKLEKMRMTVDEKLQTTLEKRLGESFSLVSERLEKVHQGLGEMQNLAVGVGDLKKVLTNVKTRGTWGEVQLGALLEQVLTTDQYLKNAKIKKNSSEVVEYVIRLPGAEEGEEVWIPIDSKFPVEDYERLLAASEKADATGVEAMGVELERRIKLEARRIREKYILPPKTTDFALMFLPTEGLYAEVMRRPGLAQEMQNKERIVLTGPSTLGAFLSSLQMGFRTLAIQKRSGEVWKILGEAQTEFMKYGDWVDKVKGYLEAASKTLDNAGTRTRAIERKLKDVEVSTLQYKPPVDEISDLTKPASGE